MGLSLPREDSSHGARTSRTTGSLSRFYSERRPLHFKELKKRKSLSTAILEVTLPVLVRPTKQKQKQKGGSTLSPVCFSLRVKLVVLLLSTKGSQDALLSECCEQREAPFALSKPVCQG